MNFENPFFVCGFTTLSVSFVRSEQQYNDAIRKIFVKF